jgi:hypothetical protein
MNEHPTRDLFSTIQIGIHVYTQKCIFYFVTKHKWLNKYNAIWLSVSPDQELTPINKSNENVSQWNAKEMKEMSRYPLGVLTQSPRG